MELHTMSRIHSKAMDFSGRDTIGLRSWLTRVAAAGALALSLTLAGGSPFGGEALAEKKDKNQIQAECEKMGGRYQEYPKGHKVCRAIPVTDNNGNETGKKFGFGCPPSAGSVVDCTPTSTYRPAR
jgi:hypothetical protein